MKVDMRKLDEFVKLTPGINQTRLKQTGNMDEIELYDQGLFEKDLFIDTEPNDILFDGVAKADVKVVNGDVVINQMKQAATIISSDNSGKLLTMNFIKVDFLNKDLDKRYFIYLFNANRDVARQKERETQGTAAVLKMPIRSIEQIEIPFLPLKEQQKIGLCYKRMLSIKKKHEDLARNKELLTLEILERKTRAGRECINE